MASAKSILESLTARNLFDLREVVAVVTGGASVSPGVCIYLQRANGIDDAQGIGLMISSTLMANGVKVYIIDISQERLDRCVLVFPGHLVS